MFIMNSTIFSVILWFSLLFLTCESGSRFFVAGEDEIDQEQEHHRHGLFHFQNKGRSYFQQLMESNEKIQILKYMHMSREEDIGSTKTFTKNLLSLYKWLNEFFIQNDGEKFDTLLGLLTSDKSGEDTPGYNNNGKDSTCMNDTGRILTALTEPWALQFFDSTGKPGPSLSQFSFNWVGNYQQCRASHSPYNNGSRSVQISGNYCVLKMGVLLIINPTLTFAIQLGACLPSTCSDEDLDHFMLNVAEHINARNKSTGILAGPMATDCHTAERKPIAATYFAIIILSLLAVMMLLGTTYDILIIQRPSWKLEEYQKPAIVNNSNETDRSGYQVIGEQNYGNESENKIHEGTPLFPVVNTSTHNAGWATAIKILQAFSLYTNGSKLLSTKQNEGTLGAINGIRFLSMSWVVLGHTFGLGLTSSVNLFDIPKFLGRWTFDPISNGFTSVDTFFTLSGLLTAYLTFKEMNRKGWKINWLMFYFHRFWRLTPPYMLLLPCVLGLYQYCGSGALWVSNQPADRYNCEHYWWRNFLYINNLFSSTEACFGHTWYLANDMQFFVLSPLMLIPFFFNRLLGLASCMLFLLISWITVGVESYKNRWPASVAEILPGTSGALDYFENYYVAPWCRIGPYVVGIMAGYFLALHHGKRYHMKWYVACIGWAIATATGLAVVYGIHVNTFGVLPASYSVVALYNALSRSAWGAAVCWVIIACALGYGGPVNALLSWSPFVVLGRLTYMSYLIHLAIIGTYYGNLDVLFALNDTNMVISYLGILVSTNMVAFVLTLTFESPMVGLEKAFLGKYKRA